MINTFEEKLVELKLGMVPNQKPYHSIGIIFFLIFLVIVGLDIHQNGVMNVKYSEDLIVFCALLLSYALWVFIIQGYRVILTDGCINLYMLYPLRIFGRFAPLNEITNLKKGRVIWGRPMQAITVNWRDDRGRDRHLYVSLDNFPAKEIQRLLDEIGKRRSDLKIPVVGRQARAIGHKPR